MENIANFAITWTGTIVLNTADATISNTATTATNALTLSGAISGSGGLTKVGVAVVAIAAPDTHTGATTVSAGQLTVNGVGQILNTSAVTLNVGTQLNLDNTRDQPFRPGDVRSKPREPHLE